MSPHFSELFRVFGRIGLLSFGGPAAQIALMHQELVEKRPWLKEEQFLRGLSFCMLLPGPEAMQLATYTGWRLRGTLGGLVAGALFVVPGACVIAALLWLYVTFGTQPHVAAGFVGIKAAVIMIVLKALWKLSQKALHRPLDGLFSLFGFVALFFLDLPFPVVIAVSAMIGAALPAWFAINGQSAPIPDPAPSATSLPLHLARTSFWAALWLVPLAALTFWGTPVLASIGWFFAKLAVVTFGGAYAVLSYMTQTVVQDHGWISSGQMVDALGLAETTPGPLILVTQFVAMLTGAQIGGATLAIAAGITALWATFVPCFLWIFAAAPFVERLTSIPRLNAALKAITATVVGVILNLSLWFAISILFDTVIRMERGLLQFSLPEWSSLNLLSLLLVLLAPVFHKLLRGNLFLLLPLMAGLAIALQRLPLFT